MVSYLCCICLFGICRCGEAVLTLWSVRRFLSLFCEVVFQPVNPSSNRFCNGDSFLFAIGFQNSFGFQIELYAYFIALGIIGFRTSLLSPFQ